MALSSEDKEEIKGLIHEGNKEMVLAMDRRLISVGINVNDPIKVQSQMNFLAKITSMSDKIVSKVIVGVVVTGFLLCSGWVALTKLKLSGE